MLISKEYKIAILDKFLVTDPSTKESSKAEALMDMANTLKAEYQIKTLRNDKYNELWVYLKNKGIYVPEGASYIKEFVFDILGQGYGIDKVKKVVELVVPMEFWETEDFFNQNNEYILPVKNGLLDLRTKKLLSFDPKRIFFGTLNVDYTPGAKCPHIMSFLDDVFKESRDVLSFQEYLGTCLIKNYNHKKAAIFNGGGDNGKSATLRLISNLFGKENCSSIGFPEFTDGSFELVRLHGKYINISGELSSKELDDVNTFKRITGNDPINARRKFLGPIRFTNYAKLFFACNTLPATKDTTDGFFTRWLYFDFPYKFVDKCDLDRRNSYHKEKDEGIIDRISTKEEMQGFLNFALEGLERVEKNNAIAKTAASDDLKRTWTMKTDSFSIFCEDYIETATMSSDYITKLDLRIAYDKFCDGKLLKKNNAKHIYDILSNNYSAMSEQLTTEGRPTIWRNIIWRKKK